MWGWGVKNEGEWEEGSEGCRGGKLGVGGTGIKIIGIGAVGK